MDPCSKLKEVLLLCNANFFFSDCLLWLAPLESHSWDWDWSWSDSSISRNSVGITTRSKSEAKISSLKDDDLSLATESTQFHCRSWIGANRSNLDVISVSLSRNGKGRKKEKEKEKEKRGHPAEETYSGSLGAAYLDTGWEDKFLYEMWSVFVWRRRRHHCRLSGRCICASCFGLVSSINYTFPS